jgi:hypothetical protein
MVEIPNPLDYPGFRFRHQGNQVILEDVLYILRISEKGI